MNSKLENDGWKLISAEDRNVSHPETFQIPPREKRESLEQGDGAKLLFDNETREEGRVVDRGVDRMRVIVRARTNGGYKYIIKKYSAIWRLTAPTAFATLSISDR